MIKDLLLHDITRSQLAAMAAEPPHAIMLIAPAGSGKKTLARHLAAEIIRVQPEKLVNNPGFIELKKPEDKTEIPIDAIRSLIKSLNLRAAGTRRVVLISQAEDLSEESQNSLLKLIEEPPQDTVFIMAVPALSTILPTVASRSQKIKLLPVSRRQAAEYYADRYAEADIASAWLLGRGAPGLVNAILEQSVDHSLKKAVDKAKSFLKMNRYERLVYLDGIAADKPEFDMFLDALDRLLAALAAADLNKIDESRPKRALAARRKINLTIESLALNTNPKLLAIDLAINLPI